MGEIISAFGLDIRLIIIQIFNFALLLAALWYFLYTPVLKLLRERQEKIEKGVADAESAAKKLAATDGERDAILRTAHTEAASVVDRARTHAKEQGQEIVGAAEERGKRIVEDATARGQEQQEQMHKEGEAAVARLAILTAEKVLREKR